MRKPNIFWIVTEGNRTFPHKDNYGLVKEYEKYTPDGVRFTNAIASATSTLMSTSSFFTGRFAHELFYAHESLTSLTHPTYYKELEKMGYTVNSTFFTMEGVQFYQDTLHTIKLSEAWKTDHKTVFRTFKDIMKKKFDHNGPNFLYIHFGAFPKLGDYVQKVRDYLEKEGLWEDSVIILSSDHGYNDYGNVKLFGWLRTPRNHSYYVTEDCYRPNLWMRLPDQYSKVRGKVIDSQVGLFDVFETVFDYLGFRYQVPNKKAWSMKQLIETDSASEHERFNQRFIRSDNRYLGQNLKKTIIRNNNYELYVEYETYKFYKRLSNHGPWKKRLKKIKNPSKTESVLLKKMLKFYDKTETEAENTTWDVLESMYKGSEAEKAVKKIKGKRIAVWHYSARHPLHFFIEKLKKHNKVVVVDYDKLKKGKFDVVFALLNNHLMYTFEDVANFCKKKDVPFLFVNLKMELVKYKKHSFIKQNLLDQAAYKGKSLPAKALIFGVYSLIQLSDFNIFRKTKENYYPKK